MGRVCAREYTFTGPENKCGLNLATGDKKHKDRSNTILYPKGGKGLWRQCPRSGQVKKTKS
jgi:hypothetical protein